MTDYVGGTTHHFAAYDGNGNVAALNDAGTGAIAARYDYGPFGEPLRATGTMALKNPLRFSTKYADNQSGLLYYGYRFYNPTTGRWPNRDPIEEQGGYNLYGLVWNNPVGFVDALGLLDYKFEVTVGNPFSLASIRGQSGRWGQPWWSADGDFLIMGARAYSSVMISSRDAPGGACNTVDQPDPAGTIKLLLRDDCPGDVHVSIYGLVQLSGTGPKGGAFGKLQSGSTLFINGFGSTTSPFSEDGFYNFKARVGTAWTVVAVYTPTISQTQDFGLPGTGTAYGFIQFLSATR